MLLFSIELAPGEREKYLRRRGGLRFAFSWSDHSRIGLGSVSHHSRIGCALEMTLQPFSANFSQMWECNFAWQAQYLVRLEGDASCSAHCK